MPCGSLEKQAYNRFQNQIGFEECVCVPRLRQLQFSLYSHRIHIDQILSAEYPDFHILSSAHCPNGPLLCMWYYFNNKKSLNLFVFNLKMGDLSVISYRTSIVKLLLNKDFSPQQFGTRGTRKWLQVAENETEKLFV